MTTVDLARAEERTTVLDITLAAYREYQEGAAPGFWERYSDNIRRSVLKEAIDVLVARQDGVIKASVLYCEPNSGAVPNSLPEMRLLAVSPEFRNLGLGARLIAACEERAQPCGALTLHTTRLMKTAKAMYERRGYVRFPAIDFEPTPGFVVWGFKKILGVVGGGTASYNQGA